MAKGTDRKCISVAEVQARLRRGEGVAIVDVRSTEEFVASHIDGAVNIPLDALSTEVARLRTAPAVVTVCSSGGGRSDNAAQLLREHGLVSVWSLCGGLRGWQEQLTQAKGARS